jgi:hypothetical protein
MERNSYSLAYLLGDDAINQQSRMDAEDEEQFHDWIASRANAVSVT